MNRALKIAEEFGKKSMNVTFDLAIAKMAYKIQEEESPKHDKLFISLGSFHIKSCLLSILGIMIAESGGPFVLKDSRVLAPGSEKRIHSCQVLQEMQAITSHWKGYILTSFWIAALIDTS